MIFLEPQGCFILAGGYCNLSLIGGMKSLVSILIYEMHLNLKKTVSTTNMHQEKYSFTHNFIQCIKDSK